MAARTSDRSITSSGFRPAHLPSAPGGEAARQYGREDIKLKQRLRDQFVNGAIAHDVGEAAGPEQAPQHQIRERIHFSCSAIRPNRIPQ
jgi:hypothetical protein